MRGSAKRSPRQGRGLNAGRKIASLRAVKSAYPLVLALCLCLALPACSLLRRKRIPPATDTGPRLPAPVGEVDLINPDGRFVLIHLAAKGAVPPVGVVLRCIGPAGETARLLVTPERKDMHITADIKSGEPQLHNMVIYDVAAPPVKPSAAAGGVAASPPATTMPRGGLINGLPDPASPEGGGIPSTSAPADGKSGGLSLPLPQR